MKAATTERVKTTGEKLLERLCIIPSMPSHVIEFLGPFPDLIRPVHTRGVWLTDS